MVVTLSVVCLRSHGGSPWVGLSCWLVPHQTSPASGGTPGTVIGGVSPSRVGASSVDLGGAHEVFRSRGVSWGWHYPSGLLRVGAHPSWVVDRVADCAAVLFGCSPCTMGDCDECDCGDDGPPFPKCGVVGGGGGHVDVPGWAALPASGSYVLMFDKIKVFDRDGFVEVLKGIVYVLGGLGYVVFVVHDETSDSCGGVRVMLLCEEHVSNDLADFELSFSCGFVNEDKALQGCDEEEWSGVNGMNITVRSVVEMNLCSGSCQQEW